MPKILNLFGKSTLAANLSYYDYEYALGEQTLIPWLKKYLDLAGSTVGDFGCHQGGVLQALRDQAAIGKGIGFDLSSRAIATSPLKTDTNLYLKRQDILTLSPVDYQFDLILFRDSLEHISQYEAALNVAHSCLRSGGCILVVFPPYYSPFGGHQQHAYNWPKLAPYLHYLPAHLFFGLIKLKDNTYMSVSESIEDLKAVRNTRLTLHRLEKAARRVGLYTLAQDLYLLRPAFKVRYGLPTVRASLLGKIPILRETFVMGAYYLLQKR